MPRPHARRGLAAGAVAALALTGLAVAPLSPASARSDADPALVLMTPFNDARAISFAYESVSDQASVRLVAETRSSSNSVTFSWNTDPAATADDPGWTTIGGNVLYGSGYARIDWVDDGGATSPRGSRIALRVESTGDDPSAVDVANDVLVGGNADDDFVESVDLDADLQLGYFEQPYADVGRTATLSAVSGTTSATEGQVALSGWRRDADEFVGISRARVRPDPDKAPDEATTGVFAKALDMRAFQPGDGVTAVLGAELGSDDAQPVALYPQQIAGMAAVDTPAARPGETVDVTVAVSDQDGLPVAGAEVFSSAAGGTRVGWTNAEGEVVVPQRGGSTRTYWANATDTDAFEAGTDPSTGQVSVPTYTPEVTDLDSSFLDTDTFDIDEYDAGDVGVLVYDQNERPMPAGTTVEYRLHPDGTEPPATWRTATTGNDGRAVVEADGLDRTLGFWTLESRVPGGSISQSDTFTVGEAEIVLEAQDGGTAPSGGTRTYLGALRLDIAEGFYPLRDRVIDLGLRRGVENVPGREADAGIVTGDGLALSHQVITNRGGSFRVEVRDLVERGDPAELGGRLTLSTGDTVPDMDSTVSGNADAQRSVRIDFGNGKGSVTLGRSGAGNGAKADRVTVTGPASVAGEKVRFVRVGASGGRTEVAERRLDARGDRSVSVGDRNGTRTTTYVVELVESRRVEPAETDPITLR